MEAWRSVVDFEGLYEVSSLGRVRSIARTVRQDSGRGRSYTRDLPSTMLRPGLAHGYRIVVLRRDGQSHTKRIAILVCRAFHGEKPVTGDRIEVAHLDGTRINDVPGNLAWTTCKENNGHKRAHGTQPLGSNHPHAKLSETNVKSIRVAHDQGASENSLARRYGVARCTIHNAVQRITWGHVA